MNILFVNYYTFQDGGTGVSIYYLAKALKRIGCKVYIASVEPYPELETFVFRKFRKIPIFQLRDLYLANFLSKIVKERNIDIIHSSECRFSAVGVIKVARKFNIPSIVHYRSYWFCCFKGDLLYKNKEICNGPQIKKCLQCVKSSRLPWEIYKHFYYRKRVKQFNQACVNIAISNLVKKQLIKFGITKNVKVIYNPISIKSQNKTAQKNCLINEEIIKNKIVISFAGKLIHHRGVANFLKVAEIILKQRKDLIFLIAGKGDMEKYCKNFINQRKLNKKIILLGNIPHEEIDQFYSISNIFFFPSILPEPFGRVIIEAMSYQCAVVASNLGAIQEIIKDGKNGFLVDPCNYSQCINRITRLIDNNELYKKITKAGIERAKDFDSIKIAKDVLNIYKKCLCI